MTQLVSHGRDAGVVPIDADDGVQRKLAMLMAELTTKHPADAQATTAAASRTPLAAKCSSGSQ